ACKPHLAGAATHFVGVRAQRLRERWQRPSQLDHIAIAVLPVIEQGEIGADRVERHGVEDKTYREIASRIAAWNYAYGLDAGWRTLLTARRVETGHRARPAPSRWASAYRGWLPAAWAPPLPWVGG